MYLTKFPQSSLCPFLNAPEILHSIALLQVYVASASQHQSQTHNCARLLIVASQFQSSHLNCCNRLKYGRMATMYMT